MDRNNSDFLAMMDRALVLAEYGGTSEDLENFTAARAAFAELIDASREYRNVWGWGGDRSTERVADRLDAALTKVGAST